MEPLLERGYSKVEPVLIPTYGGQKPLNSQQQPDGQQADCQQPDGGQPNMQFDSQQLEQVVSEMDSSDQNISPQGNIKRLRDMRN